MRYLATAVGDPDSIINLCEGPLLSTAVRDRLLEIRASHGVRASISRQVINDQRDLGVNDCGYASLNRTASGQREVDKAIFHHAVCLGRADACTSGQNKDGRHLIQEAGNLCGKA